MAMVVPRGIRNNNPLNIEHKLSNKWLGLAETPSDGRFARFVSADYGVRAAALLLMRYYDVDGLHTLYDIINKWAPGHENNVGAYVGSVSQRMGVGPNEPLNLHDRETMRMLVTAMAKHETGHLLDDVVVNRGLALAGFAAPINTKSVLATPTMFAATTVAAPAIAVSIGSVIDGLSDNSEVISGIVTTIGGPAAGGIALAVITAATWGWNLYNRLRVRQETGV